MGHGGQRTGAGRPKGAKNKNPKEDIAAAAAAENLSPLAFMLKVMNDPNEDTKRRVRMAISAAPFCHPRAVESGKKQDKQERAKDTGGA